MKSKILTSIYLAFTLIFLFGVLMSFYDYSYYGYWSDKIINWSWLLLTVLVILVFWKNIFTRIYFFLLVTLIILSILPMGIPFFGVIYNFSTIDDYQQIKLNDTYRIESTKQHALSLPRIYVYKRIGIIEKNICRPVYQEIVMNILHLKEYKKDSNRKILIKKAKFININTDSIGIDYQILDEEKIIYHKLKTEDGY